jgi:hypothetical protein
MRFYPSRARRSSCWSTCPPPVSAGMRVRCANPADSSTQRQRYHLLSAATLSNGDNRNFVHMKGYGRCGVSFAFAVRENRLRWRALPQLVQRKRPQDADRAHRNAITGAGYSAAKPSHRDDQGYSVVDGTDKERIVDGRRSGTARPLPRWRLPSDPYSPPIDRIFGSGIAPRPE